jgi:deoxyadenosine/deoxycytidine kinase
MSGKYIAIAGNMGSGKSSFTSFLCKQYKLRPFYEPNDINPYLADFYKDMKKWAYHSQIHFLTHKYRLHQELEKCSETVIQDRTIYEDAEIFATNLFKCGFMKKRDYETYYALYRTILNSLKPPDLMIYLDCSVKTLKRRINERGRAMEKSIKTDYLKKLDNLYNSWIASYDLSPVIRISTEEYDYHDDFIARQDMATQIERHL